MIDDINYAKQVTDLHGKFVKFVKEVDPGTFQPFIRAYVKSDNIGWPVTVELFLTEEFNKLIDFQKIKEETIRCH